MRYSFKMYGNNKVFCVQYSNYKTFCETTVCAVYLGRKTYPSKYHKCIKQQTQLIHCCVVNRNRSNAPLLFQLPRLGHPLPMVTMVTAAEVGLLGQNIEQVPASLPSIESSVFLHYLLRGNRSKYLPYSTKRCLINSRLSACVGILQPAQSRRKGYVYQLWFQTTETSTPVKNVHSSIATYVSV
jgi:hypothetical protein